MSQDKSTSDSENVLFYQHLEKYKSKQHQQILPNCEDEDTEEEMTGQLGWGWGGQGSQEAGDRGRECLQTGGTIEKGKSCRASLGCDSQYSEVR